MTSMLERATTALIISSAEDGPEHLDVSLELDGEEWRDIASTVLAAALDFTDEEIERISQEITGSIGNVAGRGTVRRVQIAMLKLKGEAGLAKGQSET